MEHCNLNGWDTYLKLVGQLWQSELFLGGRCAQNVLLQCILEPTSDVCGNGIVEGNEECDCGSSDAEECFQTDPCCTPGNCTLRAGANCRYGCVSVLTRL